MSPRRSFVPLKTSTMSEAALAMLDVLSPANFPHTRTLTPLADARSNQTFAVLDAHHTPIAALKLSLDNPTKLTPEHHALMLLEAHPATPNVLAHAPGALLLSWIPGASCEPRTTLKDFSEHTATQLATLLATLHTTTPPAHTQLKLLHDPMPLHDRLARIAQKSARRAKKRLNEADCTRLELALDALDTQLSRAHTSLTRKRLIHRDLNPENLIVSPHGDLLGLVDFERAAAAPPAWDFVKLRWWIFAHLPDTHWSAFTKAYEAQAPTPHPELCTLFELFESLTMLAYFAHSPQPYAARARRWLDDTLC